MFLNRFLRRCRIIALNQLNPDEEAAVFAILTPLQGEGDTARYLESEADAAIEEVRRRPQDSHPLSSDAEEDHDVIDFNGTMEPFERIADGIERLIDLLVPKTSELVGTEYIASKIGKSKQWIGKMAERGTIPKNCVAPKVGGGRIWRFHRDKIDAWLKEQR
jgi:predicted DNA-binding transcriptional regulator AlpA